MTIIYNKMTSIVVILTIIMYIINVGGGQMRNRVKELRAREGFNQTELAKRAGISRQTVSLIERNNFMPSVLTAVRIARILKENVEDIFIFEEDEL